jgi:predicted RNase H-like HicB family nuclease
VKNYDVVIWKEEGVWTAHSPSVPGAYGLGSTVDDAKRDLGEALTLLLRYIEDASKHKRLKIASLICHLTDAKMSS